MAKLCSGEVVDGTCMHSILKRVYWIENLRNFK